MNLEMQAQSLMNVRNARLAERRGFSGNVREILSELFQNSQRAGATRVEIFSTDTTLRVTDNGHGIEGAADFCKLLWMYESGYDEEVQANQQPVGVGIYSLFAHEQVRSVIIRSGGLELTSGDMERWWTDFDYYSKWQQWLRECGTRIGFELEIEGAPEFVQNVKDVLSRKSSDASQISLGRDSSAWGYEGVLEIRMDGVEVDTSIPVHEKGEITALLETTYQGNELSVFYHESYSNREGMVNWYGQLIYCDLKLKDFGFYLRVLKGSPVTPIKPTRSKLIEDQKLAGLRQFIVDALFEALNRSDQPQVNVDILYNLSRVDGNRFIRESPFFLSNAILPYESGTKQTDLEVQMQAHLYTNQPVLVDSEVTLVGCESLYDEITGMATFSRGCGVTFHEVVIGNASKLLQQTLYWKPGQPHEVANQRVGETWFYGRGEWGLGTNDQPPTVWNPVTGDVMLYDNSDGSYATDIHWMIGCDDPIDCFRRSQR